MAGLSTHKLKTRLAVVWWMIAACRSGVETERSHELVPAADGLTQVKPAAATPPKEAETLEPDTEAAELPRGVSAPAPRALDERAAEPAATAKLAPKSPKVEALTDARKAEAESAPARPRPAAPKPPVAAPARPVSRPPVAAVQPEPPVPQEPIAPVPPPPAAPKASVTVPHTEHVHVEVPAGLQHWLDEDDRMKPWLGKAINVADTCYGNVRSDNANAAGVISLAITMHENARPSGKVSSVSGPLNSIIMCATTRLLGVKMPLFTGNEGDSYTVRVHFDP